MSQPREPRELPEVTFRTACAPGLDEDDLFAAILGLPGEGVFWGDGRRAPRPNDVAWNEERERQARHAAILRRWENPNP